MREMVRDELVLKTRSLGPPRTLRLSTMSGVIQGMLRKSIGSREKRSELGVAEDSTPGKSHLYKATPILIM